MAALPEGPLSLPAGPGLRREGGAEAVPPFLGSPRKIIRILKDWGGKRGFVGLEL